MPQTSTIVMETTPIQLKKVSCSRENTLSSAGKKSGSVILDRLVQGSITHLMA